MMGTRRVRYSAKTHRGHVRAVNEDAVLSLPEQGIWVVSDGMGGHQGGAFASQTVIEALAVLLPDQTGAIPVSAIQDAIVSAHRRIASEAERMNATIGATVVVLALLPDRFVGLWSGDSRLYRLRDGEIAQLSTDHSTVAELVKTGQMTWDEADQHPMSNQITQAVGVGEDPGLELVEGALRPGDRFLICSDGLTKYANSATLQNVMSETSIERVGEKLLGIALDGGGEDNVTLVVAEIPA